MGQPTGSKKDGEVSPTLMVSLLFLVHTFSNALFLSPFGSGVRCLFWDKETCSNDEAWICDWFSFSHLHVALILTGMAQASLGIAKLETTLSYIISCIIFIYMAEGICSINVLNVHLANVQVVVFVLLLIAVAFFTAEQERAQPLIQLPRKLSTSSFDRRGKLSIATIAIGFQFVGSMFRVIEMVLGGGHSGYSGEQSSLVYRSISSMALCDMMVVTGLLGAAIRFFEHDQRKTILWYHVAALLISQAMLAGDAGEMIETEQKRSGSVGNFISLVAATMGAL